MTLPDLLRVFSNFRRDEQPEWFAHINSHGHATARLARSFADAYGRLIRVPSLDELELGARLHDIGKYLIARAILFKPGLLDEEERAAMSRHTIYGAEILNNLPHITTPVSQMVLYHHERWDGAGYPDGLSGQTIPLAVRVVSVADVYTSLRARRPYKPTFSRVEACATLARMAGRELDPNIVEDFLTFIGGLVKVRAA